MVKFCPRCGSDNIEWVLPQTWSKWECRNCGYIHEGVEAPDCCPVCKHPTAYFEVWAENY